MINARNIWFFLSNANKTCGGWQSLPDRRGRDNHNQADNDFDQNLHLFFLHNAKINGLSGAYLGQN
jgi:hypothetical protein